MLLAFNELLQDIFKYHVTSKENISTFCGKYLKMLPSCPVVMKQLRYTLSRFVNIIICVQFTSVT